jgi:hypothetical protein
MWDSRLAPWLVDTHRRIIAASKKKQKYDLTVVIHFGKIPLSAGSTGSNATGFRLSAGRRGSEVDRRA